MRRNASSPKSQERYGCTPLSSTALVHYSTQTAQFGSPMGYRVDQTVVRRSPACATYVSSTQSSALAIVTCTTVKQTKAGRTIPVAYSSTYHLLLTPSAGAEDVMGNAQDSLTRGPSERPSFGYPAEPPTDSEPLQVSSLARPSSTSGPAPRAIHGHSSKVSKDAISTPVRPPIRSRLGHLPPMPRRI